jgi:NADPH-dependent 2,4-dienoyl-CoA reductase/sulfur reductase-like enzyme
MTPQVMPGQFDTDMAESALKIIREQGVTVHTDTAVDGIITDSGNRIIAVVAGGKEYPCDIAILAAGVKPNSDIAREARITVGPTGAIKTDKHMETSMKNIYAAGDCAETTNVVSGKPSWVPLGSTANRQGRVAGANIAGGRLEFPGISATSMVKVFDAGFARAGLSDSEAKREGFNPVSVVIETPTRPGYYPGGVTITCKMTADAGSGKVLGVQAHAPETADKVIDAAAAGMMNGYTVDDFINLDTSYTPPYSLPLGALNIAATVLEGKM